MSTSSDHVSDKFSGGVEAGHSDKGQSEEKGYVWTGDITEGTAVDRRTLFERKAALVNAEIDRFGFGKYQLCLWILCGLGYFTDLAWAQGVSLMATAVFQEMGVPADQQGLIFTCSNAGLA
jgi:hypothetical protein